MPILTPQERIGTSIGGRYRIDRVLARGGMSVLFDAHDTRTHRAVAVKVLRTEDCVDEGKIARFLQEMRLTAELRDPHVVDVVDLGQEDSGVPYLVLELLRGRTLQAELEACGRLGVESALAALLPVMGALGAVHSAGVVHRDVKPDNIFLHIDDAGRVVPKLLDFGIAKRAFSTFSTRTGAVLGTPDYMSPEQVLGAEITPATDVWAMGAVLYRALCGETPFRSPTTAQTLAKLAREPAPLLRVDGLPPALCAAVDRALVRDVRARYASMDELASALATCAREAGFSVPDYEPGRALHDGRVRGERLDADDGERTAGSRDDDASRRGALGRSALIGFAALAASAVAVIAVHQAVASARDRGARDRGAARAPVAAVGDGANEAPTMLDSASLAQPIIGALDGTAPALRGGASLQTPGPSASGGHDTAAPAADPGAAEAEPPADRARPARAHAPVERADSRRPTLAAAKPLHLGDLPIAVEW